MSDDPGMDRFMIVTAHMAAATQRHRHGNAIQYVLIMFDGDGRVTIQSTVSQDDMAIVLEEAKSLKAGIVGSEQTTEESDEENGKDSN